MIEYSGSIINNSQKSIDYIINLPKDYYEKPDISFPVILFLHGAGERGNNINLIKKYGIHRFTNNLDIPFIIISPQCKEHNFWDVHFNDIEVLLQDMKKKYRANIERLCIIGISLGAYGAWNFAMQRPNLFSSIVSIAGGAMLPKYANLISHIPSYIVHGELDKEIPFTESIKISEALTKVGG